MTMTMISFRKKVVTQLPVAGGAKQIYADTRLSPGSRRAPKDVDEIFKSHSIVLKLLQQAQQSGK